VTANMLPTFFMSCFEGPFLADSSSPEVSAIPRGLARRGLSYRQRTFKAAFRPIPLKNSAPV